MVPSLSATHTQNPASRQSVKRSARTLPALIPGMLGQSMVSADRNTWAKCKDGSWQIVHIGAKSINPRGMR
jgi:hypothetical protein